MLQQDVILHINDWKVYRRAVETVKPVVNWKLLDLLDRSNIEHLTDYGVVLIIYIYEELIYLKCVCMALIYLDAT
jgi:hypothetical protein